MSDTLTYVGELVVVTCWCGMRHAVPEELDDFQARQRRDGRDQTAIYCPLGHTHIRAGEGEAATLRKQLELARNREATVRAELDQTEASLRAHKGVATKLRKRVAAGVCPCCNRTFQNLSRHMAGQHPDYPGGKP